MDFHDFPKAFGKSECLLRPGPKVMCRPSREVISPLVGLGRAHLALGEDVSEVPGSARCSWRSTWDPRLGFRLACLSRLRVGCVRDLVFGKAGVSIVFP